MYMESFKENEVGVQSNEELKDVHCTCRVSKSMKEAYREHYSSSKEKEEA